MRRLMVTGGAGFIGSNFVRYMLQTHPDYHILVYDKLTYAGRLEKLAGCRGDVPRSLHLCQGRYLRHGAGGWHDRGRTTSTRS